MEGPLAMPLRRQYGLKTPLRDDRDKPQRVAFRLNDPLPAVAWRPPGSKLQTQLSFILNAPGTETFELSIEPTT